MAPNPHDGPADDMDSYQRISDQSELKKVENSNELHPLRLKKLQIFFLVTFHVLAIYGVLTKLTVIMWPTIFFTYCMVMITGIGISAGIHRYYSHRTYKATLPLKLLLTFAYCFSGQLKIKNWVRDHRVHHKYSETKADPHDVRRGFFFAHFGTVVCEKHPQVLEKGRLLDLSDITDCPIVQFHDKYFEWIRLVFCITLPSVVPAYFWGEDPWVAFLANCFRYMYTLNGVFAINSFAHNQGHKPYDKTYRPVDNKFVSFFTLGEGWHNYHHVFPYDYRSNELNNNYNATKWFIQFMEKIGWAYDLRTAPDNMVERRVRRMGDGTHENWGSVGGVPIAAHEDELGY